MAFTREALLELEGDGVEVVGRAGEAAAEFCELRSGAAVCPGGMAKV